MGRPKGSTNKPKEVEAEAGPRVVLTDAELWAVTGLHVKAYLDAKEAIKQAAEAKRDADADLKLAVKTAEAEGVTLADIKSWIGASTHEGQMRMKAEAALLARTARWFNFKLGTQAEMFEESPAPTQNRSYRVGFEAGVAGEKATPPTDCDINAYMAGHQVGQAKLMGGVKKLEQAA